MVEKTSKNKPNIPAMVVGGGMNGLGVARNLGRNGVRIYYVDNRKTELAYSKYCKEYFINPQIQKHKEEFENFLVKIGKRLNEKTVIFPVTDLYVLYVSELKDELSDYYIIPLPAKNIVETLVNKRKFYSSLAKYDIPHPTTYFVKSLDSVKEISKEISYPTWVRPEISQLFMEKFNKKGFVARSQEDLLRFYIMARSKNCSVMAQEIIPGDVTYMHGIAGYINLESKVLATFCYNRLREHPQFGNGSVLVSRGDFAYKTLLIEYLTKIEYKGVFDAEFKKDPRDNLLKLLEINARSWWQNLHPTKCGTNIIYTAYLDAVGIKPDTPKRYEGGIKWVHFLNDLRASIKPIKNGELTPRQWLSSLRGEKVWAYFAGDDLLPWLILTLLHFDGAASRVTRKIMRFLQPTKEHYPEIV